MQSKIQEAAEYITNSKYAILVTNGPNKFPDLRVIGGFGNENAEIYFSTSRSSHKVKEIQENPQATIFFQDESQNIGSLKNITVFGETEILNDEDSIKQAVTIISERFDNILKKDVKSFLSESAILCLHAKKIKFFDFSANPQVRELVIDK